MDIETKRAAILNSAIGELVRWSPPDIRETVGPYDPSCFLDHDARRREVIDACRAKLEGYSKAELDLIADRKADDPTSVRRGWLDFHDQRVRNLGKPPPWYAGGFGHPEHSADFAYWAKNARLSVHEVLCLSVGIEPVSFKENWLAELAAGDRSRYWEPTKFLLRQRELLKRRFDSESSGSRVRAREFADWARKVDFECCPEFIRLIRQYHTETPSQQADDGPRKTDKREIDTIAQLFTAMAMEYYGYDPKQTKSPIPKEITDLAASMGLSVSDDTVRKYLKIGAGFLPQDWEPNKS